MHSDFDCESSYARSDEESYLNRFEYRNGFSIEEDFQSSGISEDSASVGKGFDDNEGNVIMNDEPDSPYGSEDLLNKGVNNSTIFLSSNVTQSQESSESRDEWYNRVKPCASDVYLNGKAIKKTCKKYVDGDKRTLKFYNMNSDGFKIHLKEIIRNYPGNDDDYRSYLLDLILCAHVKRDYSFDNSRSDNSFWKKFEIEWIHKIRKSKHRIQLFGKKRYEKMLKQGLEII